MRNKVNHETKKEIEFLESKKKERHVITSEYGALKMANNSGTLPADEWREKFKGLLKRYQDLADELLRRKRLRLDISENGRMAVTCTRKDWSDWPLHGW